MTTNNGKSAALRLIPLFFCFAVMGFIDIVGVATNYVKVDFNLSDTVANLLPSMSLIWFLLISIPSAALMNRIGRKNTVLLSLVIMAAALVLPVVGYSRTLIYLAFGLLGIGNTIMQVSLNPLLKNVISDEKMTSSLTLGQCVKSIVSFIGPAVLAACSSQFGNWKVIFYIYAAATLLALVWLYLTPIEREAPQGAEGGFASIFSLLGDRTVLMCFLTILMSVGFELSTAVLIPQHFAKVAGTTLEAGSIALSIFYAMKMAGTFVGAILLAKVSPKSFFKVTTVGLVLSFVAYWMSGAAWMLYTFMILTGLFGANIFSIAFSLAMQHLPERSNDVSALMITGVTGGAVLPPVMGIVSDNFGFMAGFSVPFAAIVVMVLLSFVLGRKSA